MIEAPVEARAVFDIHGARFAVASDLPEVAALVGATYDGVRSDAGEPVAFTITLRRYDERHAWLADSLTPEATLVSDRAAGPATLQRIGQRVVDALTARDLLLVHAAAVVTGGRALVISGPSGTGKTTLAFGLAARGMALLSDEMAVLPVDEPRVLAYRRSLHVRPGTPELVPGLDPIRERPPHEIGGGHKWAVTPREFAALMPGGLATDGRLSELLLLDPAGPGDRPTALVDVERAVATVELAHATPAAAVRLNDVLATLGGHLATVRCGRLTMGRLDDALDLVGAWMDAA